MEALANLVETKMIARIVMMMALAALSLNRRRTLYQLVSAICSPRGTHSMQIVPLLQGKKKMRNRSSKCKSLKVYKVRMIKKLHKSNKYLKSQSQMMVLKRKRKINRSHNVLLQNRVLNLEHRKKKVIVKTVTI